MNNDKENVYVLIDSISDINVAIKQDAIDNGFGTNKTSEAYIIITEEKEIYLGKLNFSNVSQGTHEGLKLKIGKGNIIKMKYINVHGRKTVYTLTNNNNQSILDFSLIILLENFFVNNFKDMIQISIIYFRMV